MKPHNFEDISEIFKDEVYKKYFKFNGDPNKGLELVDNFLEKYPIYPEALIFKIRMLISHGDYEQALQYIDAVKKIDRWRIDYLFEKAEIFYKIGKCDEAIECIIYALEHLLSEAINGVKNFLLSIDNLNSTQRDKLEKEIFFEMKKFISNDQHKIKIDKLNNPDLL